MILIILIVKFVFYPLLGLALGTKYPVVAVVSGSMEHDGTFNSWWNSLCEREGLKQWQLYQSKNITQEKFDSFPFRNGFSKGDIMVLLSPKNAKVGDIIVFNADHRNDPIIHRLVGIKRTEFATFYETKGDHNCGSADFEQAIASDKVLGKATLRLPLLGWLKIGAVELLKLAGVGR